MSDLAPGGALRGFHAPGAEHWRRPAARRDHAERSARTLAQGPSGEEPGGGLGRSVEKWRNDLDARDVALIESVCGSEMAAAGYELDSDPSLRWSTAAAFRVLQVAGTVERKARAAVRLS